MGTLFGQVSEIAPEWWVVVREGGGMALAAYCVLRLLPQWIREAREERERREAQLIAERKEDRESENAKSAAGAKLLAETHGFYLQVMERLQDRFDTRLVQTFDQAKLMCQFRPPRE